MKYILLKILIAVMAVFLSGATWLGLVLALKNSGIPLLQTSAVYVSQFSFLGWLLLGLFSIFYYLLLSKHLLKVGGSHRTHQERGPLNYRPTRHTRGPQCHL